MWKKKGKKRLSLTHIFLLMASFSLVTSPSKASYQDSVILQFLITMFNYIMEVYEEVSYYAEAASKYLGGNAQVSARKMSTEIVTGAKGVAANEEMKSKIHQNWGAEKSITINGNRYKIGSVSTVGCHVKDREYLLENNYRQIEDANENWKQRKEALVSGDMKSDEVEQASVEILNDFMVNNGGLPGLLNPNSIDLGYSEKGQEFLHFLFADEFYKKGDFEYDYDSLFLNSIYNTSLKVVGDKANQSLSGNGSMNLKDSANLMSALSNSRLRTAGGQVKSEKGLKTEQAELLAARLAMKVDQLDALREQEQLLTVALLTETSSFLKEIRDK